MSTRRPGIRRPLEAFAFAAAAAAIAAAAAAITLAPSVGGATEAPAVVSARVVSYENGPVPLAATLSLPAGEGPFPGVVLVHGSGKSSRSNPWMAAWADALVERGIAVLFPDKRGAGESGGDWLTADFGDLAGDALAGLAVLRADPAVDAARVGLAGFSQGGHVVPIAAARSGDVAFVVTVSGSVVPLAEQIDDELRQAAEAAGLGADERAVIGAIHRKSCAFATGRGTWEEYAGALAAARAGGGPLAESGLLGPFPDARDHPIWAWLGGVADVDPIPYWKEVRVPVAFLYGGTDGDVDTSKSVARIQAELLGQGLSRNVLLFGNNGHGLYRDDAADFLARWITDAGAD